jgi:hypothetical protein
MNTRIPSLKVFAAIALIIPSALWAQSNSTYNFLRNDVSPRAAALAGSFVTMTDDPDVIFYNPAGLSSLSQRRASAGFFKQLLDINSGYASFVTPVQDLGVIGFGVVYVNYGEFKETGEEGQDLGTFSANELAFLAGYGGSLPEGLRYGVNVKFIYSQIADAHSSAAAIDMGLQYNAVPDRMSVGLTIQNLGTQLNPYVTTREDLPLDIALGVALYPEHLPATLFLGLHHLTDQHDTFTGRLRDFTVGIEFIPGPNVFLRVGYDNGRRQDLKILQSAGLAGISLGFGVSTASYRVDYSYSSLGQVGSLHRIGVTF